MSPQKFLFILLIFFGGFAGTVRASEPAAASDTSVIIVDNLIIAGNQVTRQSVILRELYFREHDTIPAEVFDKVVERSRENLMNTNLFNFVTITHQQLTANHYVVIVDLKERWYIIPAPIFELVDRNFNEWIRSSDWKRVNYGFYLNWDNFRGRNESLRFIFRWGYSQRIGFLYTIPFISKNQKEGLAFGYSYSRNRETEYGVEASDQLLYKDDDNYVRKEHSALTRYTRRRGFYDYYSFTVEYRYNSVNDTVAVLNPDFLGNGRTRQELLNITWLYRRDHRDYKVYPLKGSLFDFEAVKNGIGLLRNEPNLLYFTSQYKYYMPIASRWYLAASLKGKLSGLSEAPYYNVRGLGYQNDLLRGYEYYIIPGQNYLLSRNTLKFALLPTQVITLPIRTLEKFRTIPYAFYLNANVDLGYVRDRQYGSKNPLGNELQFGYGLGLDYVTYYNLVFRVEYSFNKFGENGLFLHFTAPI